MELGDLVASVPLEVIEHIYQFSSPKDVLQNFALVCQQWRHVSLEQTLWRGMFLRSFGAGRAETEPDDWLAAFRTAQGFGLIEISLLFIFPSHRV
jgi:hypothetical protein